MRFVLMALTAVSAVALSAQEVEDPTGDNTSEVVAGDETPSSDSDEDSTN